MIAGEENEGPSSESLGVCAVADGGTGRCGLAHDGDDDELMGSELAEGREAMAATSTPWASYKTRAAPSGVDCFTHLEKFSCSTKRQF